MNCLSDPAAQRMRPQARRYKVLQGAGDPVAVQEPAALWPALAGFR